MHQLKFAILASAVCFAAAADKGAAAAKAKPAPVKRTAPPNVASPANKASAKRVVGSDQNEVPEYRATKKTFINNKLYQEGEIVAGYTGLPGKTLKPRNQAAKQRFLEAREDDRQRQAANRQEQVAANAEFVATGHKPIPLAAPTGKEAKAARMAAETEADLLDEADAAEIETDDEEAAGEAEAAPEVADEDDDDL